MNTNLSAAGYKALFITVDAPVLGNRLNETRNGLKLPETLSLPHLEGDSYTEGDTVKSVSTHSYHHPGRDPSNSWQSIIPWVKANTKLDIWLKGSTLLKMGH